jgi:putative hydrolase of the HAD superfamily
MQQPLRTWHAIVLDLDDTLFPESQYVDSGFRAAAGVVEESLGIPSDVVLEELRSRFRAGMRGTVFDSLLHDMGVDEPSLLASMIEAYRGHRPQLEPFADVLPALKAFRQRYRVGLLTDGWLEVQKLKFEALGLAPYFDAVVYSDALGRDSWKPSPAPFLTVLRLLQSDAHATVYVGDNPVKDFVGAHAAGMAAVHIRRPGTEYADLDYLSDLHRPDAVIESLAELCDVLDHL